MVTTDTVQDIGGQKRFQAYWIDKHCVGVGSKALKPSSNLYGGGLEFTADNKETLASIQYYKESTTGKGLISLFVADPDGQTQYDGDYYLLNLMAQTNANNTFTGINTVPNLTSSSGTTQIANKGYVDGKRTVVSITDFNSLKNAVTTSSRGDVITFSNILNFYNGAFTNYSDGGLKGMCDLNAVTEFASFGFDWTNNRVVLGYGTGTSYQEYVIDQNTQTAFNNVKWVKHS